MIHNKWKKAEPKQFWGTVIAAGASLLGGAMANDSNEGAAAKSYLDQRALRQTAYQDTKNDLINAGLNPMLAYQNSATATPNVNMPVHKNIAEGAANSALAAGQVENLDAQNDLLRAQATKAIAEANAIPTSTANMQQQTDNMKATLPKIENEVKLLKLQARTEEERVILTRSQKFLTDTQEELAKGNISNVEAQTRTQNVLTQLRKYEIPGAKNLADFEKMLETGSGNAGKLGQMGAKIGGTLMNSARKVMGK